MTAGTTRTLVAAGVLCLLAVGVLGADEARLWWATRNPGAEIERLAQFAGVGPGQVVAEIGAGSGEFARALAGRVGSTGRVLATELGESRLATLRDGVSATKVELIPGDTARTNLPDHCCQLVYMRHVYHHFADAPAMARDLRRAVAAGGRVAVIDFDSRFGILSLIEPAGRGGHGVALQDVVREMTTAGFVVERQDPAWTSRTFLVIFKGAPTR